MKKSHLVVSILFSVLVVWIFTLPKGWTLNDQKKVVEKNKENFLRQLDSMAFSCVPHLNRNIAMGRGHLFFPIKKGVTTYFIDGTIADSLLDKNFFVGHLSKNFVYVLDTYLAKSKFFTGKFEMIYKKIETHEITADPRSTNRWAYAINEFFNIPLKDFVRNVCFPGWNGYVGDEYISHEYPSAENFVAGWEKKEFVEKVTKKILAEKGNSNREKLLNFSRKIIQLDFTDWINEEI